MNIPDIPYLSDLKKIILDTAPISAQELNRMFAESEITYLEVKKGELIQEEDKFCNSVFIVRKGIFRNFVYDNGRDNTRWFAIDGDIFTSPLSWSRGYSASNVEAVTKAQIWTIPVFEVKQLLDSSQEWRNWALKMLIDGMGILENRDRWFISNDAYTRFKNFFTYRPYEIVNQIPLCHLASYLRITQQTLCRCRRRLAKEMRGESRK